MLACPVSRHWRRYLRFSVRGLIGLVLVIGIWLGWVVHLARIQRDAAAAIARAGGRVSYDWEWSNEKSIPGGKPWAPRWLVDRIGIDYFGHVTVVELSGTGTDATAEQVGRLNGLERLYLDDAHLSDAGLAHLKGLTSLSNLWLANTRVTDAGLGHLKPLNNLSSLGLDKTRVTNVGLNDLKKALPRLTPHR